MDQCEIIIIGTNVTESHLSDSTLQAIISFVLRSRLGGKGYAPSPDDPFVPKLKGLSEFTDLFNKMHSIIEEEDSNSRF